jgi:hypothetical protein
VEHRIVQEKVITCCTSRFKIEFNLAIQASERAQAPNLLLHYSLERSRTFIKVAGSIRRFETENRD